MFKFSKKSVVAIAAVLTVVVLQGCGVQNVKLTNQDREGLQSLTSIKVIHYNSGWPIFKTPMGVLASELTLGLSDDWSAGQKMVNKYKIEDPGKMVKDKFLNQVNNGTKVANFKNVEEPLSYEDGKLEKMKVKYKSGTVLKFSSWNWQIWYYPTNWARYQMWFGTTAELVRLDDSKVLWKANCRADQKDDKKAPTLDELTSDNSKVLQRWVEDATTECSKQLISDFLESV